MQDKIQANNIEEEDGFNLKDFLFDYLRYWYVYALALIVALSCAYFYNWYEKPVYNISTKILIKDDKSTSIGTQELLKDLDVYNVNKNIENEIEIIKSRKILERTLSQIEVDVLYYLVGNVKESQLYTESPFKIKCDSLNFYAYNNLFYIRVLDDEHYRLRYTIDQTKEEHEKEYAFGEKINLPVGIFSVNKRGHFDTERMNDPSFPKRDFKIKFNNIKNNVEFYRAKLQINQPGKNSSVIVLNIEDQVPQRGIDFLNTLVQVYLENDMLEKNKIASSTAMFIDDQLETISVELKKIETARQDFKIKKGITDVSAESKMILENVKFKDNEISNLNLKLSFIAYLEKYISENESLADVAPSSLGMEDPLMIKLIGKITELEIEKQKIQSTTVGDNPRLKLVNDQIDYTRKKLLQNITSIKDGLQASKKESQKGAALLESEMRTIPKTERELVSIEREYRVKESLYLFLLQKEAETSLALAASVSDNRIIEEARSTSYPIRPIPKKSYSLALLLSILLPTALIFLKDQLNDTVRDKNTIEKITKVPLLGLIGLGKETSTLVVADKPKSLIAESFRSIRTNLKYFTDGEEEKVILITSSVGSEGKTYTAMNLSAIIAASGKKTVLLGLDLRKPKIVNVFNISDDVGISSFLIGAEKLEDVIQKTGVENLDIIPSGPIPPNPSELIMKDKMGEMITELKKKYDTIIIDSPPIGLVTDALLLNKYADALVFVVRQNVTKKDHLSHMAQLYREGKLNNASILFNAVKSRGTAYGYGYGYGYGYYEEEKKGLLNRIFKKS
jgi:capsular exopolysaccharide synthesis family protein